MFSKNIFRKWLHLCKLFVYLHINIQNSNAMKNVYLHITPNGFTFVNFYNSTEVYTQQGFDTERKAKNYAKKYGYTVTARPEGIESFSRCD